MELILTDDNFEVELAKATLPILVDFYADWCGPCKMMAPVIDEIAKDYEGKLIIGKLNVDNSPNTASKFGVMSIPTLIVFKNAQPTKTVVGFQSKEALIQSLAPVL